MFVVTDNSPIFRGYDGSTVKSEIGSAPAASLRLDTFYNTGDNAYIVTIPYKYTRRCLSQLLNLSATDTNGNSTEETFIVTVLMVLFILQAVTSQKTPNIRLDAPTFVGDIQSTSQNGGQLAGFRNQIVQNGDYP